MSESFVELAPIRLILVEGYAPSRRDQDSQPQWTQSEAVR